MKEQKTKKKAFIVEKDGEKVVKVTFANLAYAILIIAVLLIGTGSILAYGTNSQIGEKIAGKISRIVPFPASIVDWHHVVFFGNLEKNVASAQQYYETQSFAGKEQIDFNTDYGQKRLLVREREILDKLTEDQIIKILAQQHGISVSSSQVDQAVSQKLKDFGTANDVQSDLLKSYGWTLQDFKDNIVFPSMYADALAQWFATQNQNGNEQTKAKITQAQKDLQSGKDFAQVASQYSDGASKQNGGKLGWVKQGQIIPELANALFAANPPSKDQIIESSIGYHIVQIENQKKEGNESVLQLRQIFVAKNTFTDWLQKQKQQFNVWVPLNGFRWNKQTGSIEFTDPAMQAFEKDQRAKVQGGASIVF